MRELKSAMRAPLLPSNMAAWSLFFRSMKRAVDAGRALLRYLATRIGPRQAVAPGADFLQLADGAVADEFADAVEVLKGMALGTDLSGELVFVFEVVGADHAGLLNTVGERLFAIDVFAAIHRPVGDESVRVI